MNWNNNDTKYIIKKLVIYFLIAFAMFIFSTWKAKAETIRFQPQINYYYPNNNLIHVFNNRVISDNRFWGVTVTNTGILDSLSWVYPYTPPVQDGSLYNYTFIMYSSYGGLNISLNGKACYTIDSIEDAPNNVINTKMLVLCSNIPYSDNLNIQINNEIINTHGEDWVIGLSWVVDVQRLSTNDVANAVNEVNNSIKNDNITSSDADNFKNNEAFSDTTGLESVINLPLNMVSSLSNQCQPIQVHIPFLEVDATIPCMSTIYRSKFNSLYTLVKLVVNGFLVYRILLKVYELVHEAKQPDEDKLEVIDL